MERARQIRRDLITVAVVVVLLGAAMLLISSNAASAQTATEDQYSSATSASASASATASANPTSDQYPNGSSGGGTASSTTPAPVDNTGDASGTQATADALQSTLQVMALQIALQGIGLGHPPAVPGASTIGGSSFLDLAHWGQQTLGGSLGQAVIDWARLGLPDPLVHDDCETRNTDGHDDNGDGRDHDCATSGPWDGE